MSIIEVRWHDVNDHFCGTLAFTGCQCRSVSGANKRPSLRFREDLTCRKSGHTLSTQLLVPKLVSAHGLTTGDRINVQLPADVQIQ